MSLRAIRVNMATGSPFVLRTPRSFSEGTYVVGLLAF